MSYQVLARKWRPKSFDQLVGQAHIVKALSHSLDQDRLHHAYLFTGTRGVGKTTLGRILAKAFNCEAGVSATPCGTCGACNDIDRGRFVDLLEIDAASNTGVDNMRELLENALYAPTVGRFKVYLIDEVHMLSKPAFNAILKTLEEPPAHIKFIFATTDPQKIPVTVLSRCLRLNLRPMTSDAIEDRLKYVLSEERVPFDVESLALIARSAQGSMRDALSLLDQAIAYGSGTVALDGVRAMLGTVDDTHLLELVERLAKSDASGLWHMAETMGSEGVAFDGVLVELGRLLHNLAVAQTVPDAIGADAPHRGRLVDLAKRLPPETVQLWYQIVMNGIKDYSWAPDPFAGFTMTLLRMLSFVPSDSLPNTITPVARAQSESVQQPAPEAPTLHAQFEAAESPGDPPAQKTKTSERQNEEASAVEMQTSISAFDGDWPGLVKRLRVGGMARMLAQHAELVRVDDDGFHLGVLAAQKHLLEKGFQEKLGEAVRAELGLPVRLHFSVCATVNDSPAQRDSARLAAEHAKAADAIAADPFVQQLIQDFEGSIVGASVKPISVQEK